MAARIRLAALLLVAIAASARSDEPQKPAPVQDAGSLLKRFHGEFVEITPGQGKFPRSFTMGTADGVRSETPAHKVTFNYSFSMARYEVTQELYKAVMGKNPSIWQGPKRGRNSVEMVSWRNAVAFSAKATTMLRDAKLIGPGDVVRLPSEAEWEYCCRAGTTGEYSFKGSATWPGDTPPKASGLDRFAWHTGNAAGNDPPVGAKKPNAWGLYDMHGYLWEFVADAWHADYAKAPTDGGPWGLNDKHVRRVMRGGSWRDRFEDLRCATRQAIPDHVLSDAIGFRCVLQKAK